MQRMVSIIDWSLQWMVSAVNGLCSRLGTAVDYSVLSISLCSLLVSFCSDDDLHLLGVRETVSVEPRKF